MPKRSRHAFAPTAKPASENRAEQSRLGSWKWAGIGLIALAALVAYFPCLHGSFLFDDGVLIWQNPTIQSPDALYRIWFTTEPIDYWPVTNTAFWLEWRQWRTGTTGYHVVSLLLHISGSLLVWAVLRKLAIPGAFIAAILFAVHPVNVESVAWISQQKNLLSLLFLLVSAIWYLKSEGELTAAQSISKSPNLNRWYWLSLFAFLLAMFSKGSVAILPLILLLIAWWQRGRITRVDLIRTVPFFVIAAVLTAVNMWFQQQHADQWSRDATLLQRLLGAAAIVWFYLYKALIPINLAFVYPQWEIHARDVRWWLPLLAAVGLTALLWWQRRTNWGRAALFAWAYFCIALLPVMGFTDVGFMKYSLVADHYQHIAIIGVVALVAAALVRWQSLLPAIPRFSSAAACLITVFLTVLCWQQARLYSSPILLYQATLEKNPTCWIAHNNLGWEYSRDGNFDAASKEYRAAIELNPRFANPHYYLGILLGHQGRIQDAIAEHLQATELNPKYAEAHKELGQLFANLGENEKAKQHFQKAIDGNPSWSAELNCVIGNIVQNQGLPGDAAGYFQLAIDANPRFALPYNNLAWLLATSSNESLRDPAHAVELAQKAVELDPKLPGIFNTLGVSQYRAGDWEGAIESLEKAIKSADGGNAFDWFFLAMANQRLGRNAEARDDYEKAVDWMLRNAPQSQELIRFRQEADAVLSNNR
jgi:tetratricopeptide (TPR) repeat protein